jgi:hypothetical protein
MGENPYNELPASAFWKTGVTQENPFLIKGIYKKKFTIPLDAEVATAGSCFAQHISRHLKVKGYNLLDVEPPPPELAAHLHLKHGFSMYSARYGNIYTVRQLLQLAEEVSGDWEPRNYIWEKNGRYYDALRPAVGPEGLSSPNEVIEHRKYHISKVKELFQRLDILIFTLGLTEMWIHKDSGTVYPTAPGTLVGEFDKRQYIFKNAQFADILHDFNRFQRVLGKIRNNRPFKILLTVSPVPLTASASGNHVLVSTIYSKSTLRSVAGQLSANQQHIDYFPSYEIVTNPRLHSVSFSENLRTVRDEAVENVMKHFFSEHSASEALESSLENNLSIGVQCEEALLEGIQGSTGLDQATVNKTYVGEYVEVFGNSHMGPFLRCCINLGYGNVIKDNFVIRSSLSLKPDFKLGSLEDLSMPLGRESLLNFKDIPGPAKSLLTSYPRSLSSHPGRRAFVILLGGLLGYEGCILPFGSMGSSLTQSPVLPIVRDENDIDPSAIEIFVQRLRRKKELAASLRDKSLPFCWIGSPMMPEKNAIGRWGEKYVYSSSQAIYNRKFREIFDYEMKEFIQTGNILLFDETYYTANGFLDNAYSLSPRITEAHASPDCYKEIAETILAKMMKWQSP